jgi:hypothetical protein
MRDPRRKATAPGISRRAFLRASSVTAIAGALGCSPKQIPIAASANAPFDFDADVVVVGAGVIGACAALFATHAGARALLLEKSARFGGTAVKSAGVYWVPHNSFVRGSRSEPSRAASLSALARYSYPQIYDSRSATLGLPPNEYALIEAVYDAGAPAVEKLAAMGALISSPASKRSGPMPDYVDDERSDKAPLDRRLRPLKPDGTLGSGDEMVRQVRAAVEREGIPVLTEHRVQRLIANEAGEVVGLEAERGDGSIVRVRAKRGVVFATGGFTHNPDLVRSFQNGPIYGGCAVPTNEGDFVYMAAALGARLGHMQSAWYAQLVLEQALKSRATPDDVFMPPGDSMILVNRLGRRVVNEKSNHHDRTQVHFHWDPGTRSWINQLLFMIYDQRTADLYAGRFPLPARGARAPYVLRGDTLEALSTAIDGRLARIESRTGGVRLDLEFPDRLAISIKRFNKHSESGIDPDFDRGGRLQDRLFHARVWSFPNRATKWPLNDKPNVTMYPVSGSGPYYAILLAAGTIDTHGGPVANAEAQILASDGRTIAGLYGAGNCIASPTGRACYGHGATFGPALAFAYLAGTNAAAAYEKSLS